MSDALSLTTVSLQTEKVRSYLMPSPTAVFIFLLFVCHGEAIAQQPRLYVLTTRSRASFPAETQEVISPGIDPSGRYRHRGEHFTLPSVIRASVTHKMYVTIPYSYN